MNCLDIYHCFSCPTELFFCCLFVGRIVISVRLEARKEQTFDLFNVYSVSICIADNTLYKLIKQLIVNMFVVVSQ